MQAHLKKMLLLLAVGAGSFWLIAQPGPEFQPGQPGELQPAEIQPGQPIPVEQQPDQVIEQPAVEQPGLEQPPLDQPAVEQPVIEQPAIEQQPAQIPAPTAPPVMTTNSVPFNDRQALRRRFRTLTNSNAAPPAFPTLPAPTVRSRTNIALPGTVTPAAGQTGIVTETDLRAVPSRAGRTNFAFPTLPVPGAPERTANPIPAPGTVPAPETGVPPADVAGQVANTTSATDGLAPANSPLAPGLDPNETLDAGLISMQSDLNQFLDVYQQYSGRTVLRPYTLPAPATLILKAATPLTRREVVEAMDAVLALNNITMIPMADKFVKAVPSNLAGQEGAELSRATAEELPMAEQFITKVVKLKTAKPSEVAQTLQALAKTPTAVTAIDSNQTIILRDYSSNVKRMLEILEKIDVMPESDFTLEVIPIKYGKVGDIYATMSALISGTGGTTGAGVGTTGSFGAGGMGRMGGMGGSGFRGGGMNSFGGMGSSRYGSSYGGSGYGSRYGNYGSQYGGGSYMPYEVENSDVVSPQQVVPQPSPGASQGSFQQRLNQIVNRAAGAEEQIKILENANIVPDERSNKLLIFANKRDMAMITNIVSKVDVMLAQVLIEAIIMEVSLGDTLNVGVSALQHPKRFGEDFTGGGNIGNGPSIPGVFTNATAPGFTYFGNIGNDFDVAISMLATDNKVNVLSRPRIQTSHAIPGSFFHGETRPYVSGFTDYGLVGSGLSTRSTITQQEIGISLDVVPFITPEGMVVMEIFQNTQSHPGDVTIDGNPIPVIGTRSASSVLTVRNGDIIMLGGFIQEENRNGKSGVPFLKDIPGLGVLFRSKTSSKNRNEVIVLLKATVLETPEEAAFLAETERRQLPGIRQAEREFQENDEKRMKKVIRKE